MAHSPSEHRQALEDRYEGRITEDFTFAPLVTYVPCKTLPVYRWFRYKEAFAPRLIQRIVCHDWKLPHHAWLFDPFGGCGNTPLAAQQLGYCAFALDILPVSVFIARAKLQYPQYDEAEIRTAVARLFAMPFSPPAVGLPEVHIIERAYTEEVQKWLVFFRDTILSMTDVSKQTRDFLLMGLLSILETVSFTAKDGQFLRLVQRPIPDVQTALQAQYELMLNDLQTENRMPLFGRLPSTQQINLVSQGDARQLPFGPGGTKGSQRAEPWRR